MPGARQAADPGHRLAPPFRSQCRLARGGGRGADDHRAAGERGYLPRDVVASGGAVSRRAWPESAALEFIPVDDHLKMKDKTNEIDIYHVIDNYHMADAVIVHVPARACWLKQI